jgi:hypothetical protein
MSAGLTSAPILNARPIIVPAIYRQPARLEIIKAPSIVKISVQAEDLISREPAALQISPTLATPVSAVILISAYRLMVIRRQRRIAVSVAVHQEQRMDY